MSTQKTGDSETSCESPDIQEDIASSPPQQESDSAPTNHWQRSKECLSRFGIAPFLEKAGKPDDPVPLFMLLPSAKHALAVRIATVAVSIAFILSTCVLGIMDWFCPAGITAAVVVWVVLLLALLISWTIDQVKLPYRTPYSTRLDGWL